MLRLLIFLLPALLLAQPAADLDFTSPIGDLRDLPQALTQLLIADANRHLAVRPVINSPAALQARAAQVRRQILQNIGGLPAQTPLHARTGATLQRGKYRIEKVIFESQPRFYVTANLYIPNQLSGPAPAILFPLGHEAGGKAHDAWQIALGSFASKGFVALAWDPVGHGERSQFFDPDTRTSKLVRSTTEHSMLGAQTLLTGDNIARYMIHDGIRALDYLAARPEVDPNRIGVTGNSGGGTLTAYLAAVDDRLKVAAPSCYITSAKSLLTQLGPQDAEQNLPPWISAGFDFPDFLYAFNGKPYLILSALRDFFPIGGARATYAEALRVYDQLGQANKLSMVEADDGHGYTKPRRLAAYAWFSRWLAKREDDGTEPDIQLATEEELQCTTTGQVQTSLAGETVFSLNKARIIPRPALTAAQVLAKARELTAYNPASNPPKVTPYGALSRPTYRLEKLTYESEPGIQIPAVLAVPHAFKPGGPTVLLADCNGKSAAAARLDQLAQAGTRVLSIDLRGCGELTPKGPRGIDPWLGDSRNIAAALLLGRSMLGMRMRDLTAGLDLLAAPQVTAIGIGHASLPVLFATALDPRITAAELDGLLKSYQSVVETPLHRRAFEHVLPGVLRHFDIADVVKAIAPRPVTIVRPVDPMGQP